MKKRSNAHKVSKNIEFTHEDRESWRTFVLSNLLRRFEKKFLIRRKRRCPKCGSDKWEQVEWCRGPDLWLDGLEMIAMGGHEFVPRLIKYKCNKCGEEFKFWERGCIYCSPIKGKCYVCGSDDWQKLKEDTDFVYFKCKHCRATILIDKKKKSKL